MRRAFLAFAVWLTTCFSAHALPIGISTTYTNGAATYASGIGTTVPVLVAAQISVANTNYSDSGINVALTQYVAAQLATQAPADSAGLASGLWWVRRSISALHLRTLGDNGGSSISAHISNSAGTTGMTTAMPTVYAKDAFFAYPISALGTDPANANFNFELSVSAILGDTQGYKVRKRIAGEDTFCMHTRESGPTDPDQIYPLLPYYVASSYTYTQANSQGEACDRWRFTETHPYSGIVCPSSYFCTSDVVVAGPLCRLKNTDGSTQHDSNISSQTGSTTISCTEISEHRYASPSLALSGQALGDSTHDSVTPMNAKVTTVYTWTNSNLGMYKAAVGAARFFWNSVQ